VDKIRQIRRYLSSYAYANWFLDVSWVYCLSFDIGVHRRSTNEPSLVNVKQY